MLNVRYFHNMFNKWLLITVCKGTKLFPIDQLYTEIFIIIKLLVTLYLALGRYVVNDTKKRLRLMIIRTQRRRSIWESGNSKKWGNATMLHVTMLQIECGNISFTVRKHHVFRTQTCPLQFLTVERRFLNRFSRATGVGIWRIAFSFVNLQCRGELKN